VRGRLSGGSNRLGIAKAGTKQNLKVKSMESPVAAIALSIFHFAF
jgi:hypothetical protein